MFNPKNKCVMINKSNYQLVAKTNGDRLFIADDILNRLLYEQDDIIYDIRQRVRNKDLMAHLASVAMERKGDLLRDNCREREAVDAYHTAAWLALNGRSYTRQGRRVKLHSLLSRSAEMVEKAVLLEATLPRR